MLCVLYHVYVQDHMTHNVFMIVSTSKYTCINNNNIMMRILYIVMHHHMYYRRYVVVHVCI